MEEDHNKDHDKDSAISEYRSGRFRLFSVLIASVIIGERAIDLILHEFGIQIYPISDVFSPLVLTAILFPILYFAVFKDVVQKNKMLATTEGRLRAAHNWLEQCVNERTKEIQSTNQKLEEAVQSLKHQRHEMAVVAEMGHLLQVCNVVEEACRIAEDHLHRLFPNMSGALYLKDESRESLEKITAWGKGAQLEDRFERDDCWALRHNRPHQVDGRSSATTCAHRGYQKDEWHLCLPIMAQGETLGLICLQADCGALHEFGEDHRVSEERLHFYVMIADSLALAIANLRLRNRLQQQAVRDSLTDLYNRRFFDEALDRELKQAARSKLPLSLVMLDIDDFKRFNDTFGHGCGDALLQAVGEILQKHVREGDIACRFGGDEFALILPGVSADVAGHRTDLLREEIKTIASKYRGGVPGEITVSTGIAEYPLHAKDKKALVDAADKAMYSSKQPRETAASSSELANEKSERSFVA